MKITTLFSSTILGKTKLFIDYEEAMLHGLAFIRNIPVQKTYDGTAIKPVRAFFDGTTYFAAVKVIQTPPRTPLESNRFHQLYIRTVDEGGGQFGGGGSYEEYLITELPDDFQEYHVGISYRSEPLSVYKDEDGILYTVGKELQMVEKSSPALAGLRSCMDESADQLFSRKRIEYQQKQSLFSQQDAEFKQKQAELKQKQEELKRTQQELTEEKLAFEAARLAGDAMDLGM